MSRQKYYHYFGHVDINPFGEPGAICVVFCAAITLFMGGTALLIYLSGHMTADPIGVFSMILSIPVGYAAISLLHFVGARKIWGWIRNQEEGGESHES